LIKGLLVIIFFSSFNFLIGSENTDTTKISSLTYYFREKGFMTKDSILPLSYKLDKFEQYNYRFSLSNLGLAGQELIFSNNNELGFRYSKNYYSYNYFHPKSFIYYNTRSPYSEIFYVAGSKKEQFFKMIFSYNVKKNWNVSVDFKKTRSEGFYLRQQVAQTYFALSSNYLSNNNRYGFLANLIYNSPNHIENGGILNDSTFDSQNGISKNALSVNLTASRKKINNRSLYVKQYFNLGKMSADTTVKGIIPSSSFILTTHYSEDRYSYSDDLPLSGYYDNIYIDSVKTNDSMKLSLFENEIEWRRRDNKKHIGFINWLGLSVKFKNQLIWYKQMSYDTSMANSFVGGEIYNLYSKNNFWFDLNANYCISGYNKKDYVYSIHLRKILVEDKLGAHVFAFTSDQEPDFIYRKYTSNHFDWENIFLKTKTTSVGGGIFSEKYAFKINVEYSKKSNVIYFDNYALPRQYNGSMPIFKTELIKDFSFKGLHLNNSLIYQYVPDSVVIRLPELVLNHSLYYEFAIFRKAAMRLQIGATLSWFSGYYANAFMPATSQFYLQNERIIGNYPFVDFFVNAKVKMVRIFIKVDHLNSGLTGNNYFIANHYPINDRAFKLGISWRFLD